MASYVWISDLSGNWSDAALWSPNSVPGGADDVEVEATGAAFTVTVSSNVAVQSVVVGDDATVSLSGVSLGAATYVNGAGSTLSGFGTIAAVYSGAGAIVANGGVLDFTVADDVFGGAISGTGTLEIAANATLATASIKVDNLEIEGSAVTVTTDENITITSSIVLGAGAIFSVGDDVTVAGANTLSGAVNGAGSLTVSGGSMALQAGATLGVAELLQSGGSMTFNESLGFSGSLAQAVGTISIGLGDVLTLSGDDDLFNGTVAGSGELDLAGVGRVTFGAATPTVAKIVVSGDEALSFDDDVTYAGTFDEEAGTLLISDTLKLSGIDTLSGAVSGGDLDIIGGVTTVTGTGSLGVQNVSVSAGAVLAIESADDDIFKVASNSGVILVEADVARPGLVSFDDVLTQSAKGVVKIGDDASVAFNANVKGGLIDFAPGNHELLEVDDSTIAVGAHNTITFGAKIKNFGFGDSIGIVGATVKKVSQSQSGGDTLLHVTTSDDDIVFTLVGNYANLHFFFASSSASDEDLITVSHLVTTPVFTGANTIVSYHETGSAVAVDAQLRLDPGISEISRAKVAISGGFLNGDTLKWVGEGGVLGVYDALKGVLKLTGDASAATYAAIFDSIAFSSTNAARDTRTVTFTATSGAFTSAPATATVKVRSAPAASAFTGSAASVGESGKAAASASFDFTSASALIGGASPAHEASLALATPVREAWQGGWLAGSSAG